MTQIGFLGIGIMGRQMVGRLLEEGHKVMVWNRTPSRCDELVGLGATRAASPQEVASSCEHIFAMLSDPVAAEAVVFETNGVLATSFAGKIYVDCSTLDAVTNLKVGRAINAAGGNFLASPVSGGWREAKAGKLLLLTSGDRKAYDSIGAELSTLGERSWYLGSDPGAAAQAKLGLQVMMGSFVGALGEAISLTAAAGVDPEIYTEMLGLSAMRNPLCAAKGKVMISGNYSPNFQVYLIQKDLRLALELANRHGIHAPITAAAHAQYSRATALGLENSDFAAVKESCKGKGGVRLHSVGLLCAAGLVAIFAFQAGRKFG